MADKRKPPLQDGRGEIKIRAVKMFIRGTRTQGIKIQGRWKLKIAFVGVLGVNRSNTTITL
jgi:hypothetical protein